MTLKIDLVVHMDAGDRNAWRGDQNLRPVTELGRRQAEALAEALAREAITGIYTGPALRCRQTVEPLAARAGLEFTVLEELGEENWRAPDGWNAEGPTASAFAAGRALAGIERIRREHRDGHIVACSHGHILPALVSMLIGAHGLPDVREVERRGQWHRLEFDGDGMRIERQEAAGFPA